MDFQLRASLAELPELEDRAQALAAQVEMLHGDLDTQIETLPAEAKDTISGTRGGRVVVLRDALSAFLERVDEVFETVVNRTRGTVRIATVALHRESERGLELARVLGLIVNRRVQAAWEAMVRGLGSLARIISSVIRFARSALVANLVSVAVLLGVIAIFTAIFFGFPLTNSAPVRTDVTWAIAIATALAVIFGL